MKQKIIIALLFVLLCFEFALAAYSILAHQWIGLIIVTLLIFAVMYLLDREVRKMRGELPSKGTPNASDSPQQKR
ncbi:MAG: hypothetical protein WAN89_01895 [Lawsonella sp.]